ncbi:hypothetical protein G6F32_010587 [Rhizopus arrhizus]|nr:hypothetical protein G6F32_010587 [Rhizopus arrhizus]
MVTSVIDYIYLGQSFYHHLKDTSITRLNAAWSDHSVLDITLVVGQSPTGPGLWRANPTYATHLEPSLSPAEKWDRVKASTKKVIKQYGYEYLIGPIDTKLGQLQHELVEIERLKSGIRWRERGEKDAGYLKNLYQRRSAQQFIASFQRPTIHGSNIITVEIELPVERTSDPIDMREVVRQYYQQLYTLDHVEDNELDQYLASVTFDKTVRIDENDQLMSPITIEDLLDQVKRCPKQSSPGDDGLGYQFLEILFQMPFLQPLILEVYNNALTTDSAPASWKDIRVRLLPKKKGDLTDLKNWRPISLINCGAKILSRAINSRLNPIMNNIFQCSQTGFMKGRFIGENCLLLHLLLNQARYRQYPGIGLLLDQEKTYDRVNPQYLMKVMEAFGFRRHFLTCVHNFFLGNLIEVNVNGYFTSTVFQQRGLRQGDPLSPLLFNLALEPLLLSIQQDRAIIGYGYESDGIPQSVKTIAYADDVCVILNTQDDFTRLQYHLSQYSQVSNAKFNQAKTEAFSLNGDKDENWERYLLHYNISTYHTEYSFEPFRYLGFYMAYTIYQRNSIQDNLLHKVKDQVKLYSSRHLSLRRRATVTNTLIMTKIWFALRLLHPTQAFLKKTQEYHL